MSLASNACSPLNARIRVLTLFVLVPVTAHSIERVVSPDMNLAALVADADATADATADAAADAVADAAADSGVTFRLLPGTHRLTPHPFEEPLCGNCEDPNTRVRTTVGLLVAGRGVRILGEDPATTILETNAGYGVLFEDCDGCEIANVTITGGTRDPDGHATSAAVVVRRGRVGIDNCTIRDNIGDPALIEDIVVGIIGIAGREGADLVATNNRILRNSWDGIALYRDATATITGNVIDGVDRARGRTAGGGRGVGIGVTWNARADIRGNLVRNYWKGIGLFVDADGTLEENVVEHMLTWGVSVWDAGKGRPKARVSYNAIYDTGACGLAVVRADSTDVDPGYVLDNAIVASGQDPRYDSGEPYCYQTAIARHAVPSAFAIADNRLFDNRHPEDAPPASDLPADVFRAHAALLVERLSRWSSLLRSDFLVEFGR